MVMALRREHTRSPAHQHVEDPLQLRESPDTHSSYLGGGGAASAQW